MSEEEKPAPVFGEPLPKLEHIRKQIPLRMEPPLFDKLELMAKVESKSINQFICDTLEDRTRQEGGKVHLDDVRRVIRQAIEAEVRAKGWAPQAPEVQAAILKGLESL